MPPRTDLRSEKWDLNTIPDLTGKVALVTGANASESIGFNTVKQLAMKGATVYLGARNEEKSSQAIEHMIQTTPEAKLKLKVFAMDVGDLKDVYRAARKFLAEESQLDILINNAGLLARPLDFNEYGISVSMTTNHLGPFLFTNELLPIIKNTPYARVITLSSTTHVMPPSPIKLDSVEAFNQDFKVDNPNLVRYGLSKLANLLFAKELQKRYDADGVNAISLSLHPGGVQTPGAINFIAGGSQDEAALKKAQDFLRDVASSLTPLEGALTSLYAATNPAVWEKKAEFGGAYLMPFGVPSPGDTSENAKNEELAKELWAASETIVKNILYS